ncbi:MAG: NAD-dependent epimerase/dehydratase family protein [Xanthomonadaceae bacterium]|nr:NAD-dependent epimerase/dehydratase family protein [Xanthomonadaceae bacterium]
MGTFTSAQYSTGVRANDFHPETKAFFSGRRVAVTGGTGFIGSHLVEQLVELKAKPIILTRQLNPEFLSHIRDQVEIKKCDLKNRKDVLSAFKDCSTVLSLAASVAGLEYNSKHPATIFQENLETFFNTIGAAKEIGVERFLTTSSACVYPRHCTIPTPEIEGMKDEPEPTNSGYGWSKRMEEFLSQKYAEEFGMSIAIARPYNSYGPRDNFKPESSHVIPALILKAFETKESTFSVWGDGSHSRSFLYVDDFARGLLEVTARYPQAIPLNIGAEEETRISEVADWIAEDVSKLTGRTVKPKFNPQGLTGQPRRKCDGTKAFEAINFKAKVSFREGLRKTIEWYFNKTD